MIKAEFNESINDLTTENLYQWDSYQTLVISGVDFDNISPKVHFCNKKSIEALAVQGILKNDGTCEVSIPNTLLGEKYDILAYIYTNTGLTYKTIKSITIPIIPRLKPTNYTQPSNEEIAEIEEIELQAKAILNGLYVSDYDSTKAYKRPNIVYYNYSSYMCISDAEITGILPTDTTKWKLIAESTVISDLSKDQNGNLVFTFSNGATYSAQIAIAETTAVDKTVIPALELTSADVTTIRSIDRAMPGAFDSEDEPECYNVTLDRPGVYYYYKRNSAEEITSGLFSFHDLDFDEPGHPGTYNTRRHVLSIPTTNVDDVIIVKLLILFYEV